MTDLRKTAQQALDAWDSPMGMKDMCVAMDAIRAALRQQQAEPVAMRMPKVGDKVICLEDESLGTVESLTAGGSPDIVFDDGSRGTYLLREFAELFGYVAAPQRPWVGLTDEDVNRESAPIAQQMKLAFHAGMYVAQKILKEKNSD